MFTVIKLMSMSVCVCQWKCKKGTAYS